jgi:L-fuculose-phosphate aldolase
VLTWGKDPEMALLRMELVEHMARIAHDAAPYGGVRPLPREALPRLLEARAKAGLGPEGRKRKQPRFLRAEDEEHGSGATAMGVMRRISGARRE